MEIYQLRTFVTVAQQGHLTQAAELLHLSQPAVTERVRKLEASGIITGYRATVSPSALGYSICAVVRVGRSESKQVMRAINDTPEVTRAHNITGEDSWILEIAVRDVAHLDAVVSRFCALGITSTAIILKSPRKQHSLVPAERYE